MFRSLCRIAQCGIPPIRLHLFLYFMGVQHLGGRDNRALEAQLLLVIFVLVTSYVV